jgi:hypothetical protein
VRLHILCSLTKFCKKKIIFVICVKKTIFMLQNYYLRSSFFIFFYTEHKKYLFTPKLWWMDIERSDALPGIFCSIFLIFLNAFKMYFHNRCICSYEPKHHVQYNKTCCMQEGSWELGMDLLRVWSVLELGGIKWNSSIPAIWSVQFGQK